MTDQMLTRRHSRWYEVILFSRWLQFLLGYAFVVLFPNWLHWSNLYQWPMPTGQANTLIANTFAYLIAFWVLRKLRDYPGTGTLAFVLPTILASWALAFAVLLFMRGEAYARTVLLYSLLFALTWAFASSFFGRRYRRWKLAIVPFGKALEIKKISNANIVLLDQPDLEGRRYDAVVADLGSPNLTAEWLKFLADCALAHIPVFHTQQLIESLTGRVQINHLSENIFGNLLPSAYYLGLKRLIDFFAALLLLPIVIPVLLIACLAIKLDSEGSAFYNQTRMGYQGRTFTMYKLRSMRSDMKGRGFTEGEDDPRITRVGAFIRKYRIDELPQIFNVLKGEMSFIGPRPESIDLSTWYEKEVPFFSYRHVVRPGISGWAQVKQGYAAEVDGMTLKLQYDFYYIKHCSFWLDILISAQTIKTIFSGFGAR